MHIAGVVWCCYTLLTPSPFACELCGTCSMGLSLPGLALAQQLYVAVEVRHMCSPAFYFRPRSTHNPRTLHPRPTFTHTQAQGHGRKGTHALMLALEHMNGMTQPEG